MLYTGKISTIEEMSLVQFTQNHELIKLYKSKGEIIIIIIIIIITIIILYYYY